MEKKIQILSFPMKNTYNTKKKNKLKVPIHNIFPKLRIM
jgi:hypothetical protein